MFGDLTSRLSYASDSQVLDVLLQASAELKRRARPPFWDLLDGVIRIYGTPEDSWCLYKTNGRFACEIRTNETLIEASGDTPIEAAIRVCADYRLCKDAETSRAIVAQSDDKIGRKA